MSLIDIPQIEIELGTYQRPDGQHFIGRVVLFEFPDGYDYWQAAYDMAHGEWGHMRFVLTIPKSIAASSERAQTIVCGGGLEQVKRALDTVTQAGRPLSVVFAWDGWTLL